MCSIWLETIALSTKTMARLIGMPLVGCASHRLNLAVREHLAPYDDNLEQVQTLLRKLRTLKQAAKLRQKTPLEPVLHQDTRWSSTYAMLERYFQLYEHLSTVDEELEDLLPSRATHRSLRQLFDELKDVESISKKLHSSDLTMLDARDLLDDLLEIQPSFAEYLAPNAAIVQSPDFEAAAVRVLGGDVVSLSTSEKAALQPFRRSRSTEASREVVLDDQSSFAERILKRRKVDVVPIIYVALSAIPPTPSVVERLFSSARAVLRHERRRLSPLTLEMILFLKVNCSYWNVATVDGCL
ncbi:hypothetical protein V7S43_019101 [Phytophthora oleae]|uniref:HAT C-terminal dimerisation domain-containing protein n=1 Tax=Phytophthora oleae TaxID=2107226 RepID=A0ABD3ETK3_9STRA